MLKNNIKIAWRSLKKDRQFTFLNLVGLSTGLACALFIYLWVTDELHVDKFNQKDSQLYMVMENRKKADGVWTSQNTSVPTAEALAKEMPEVEYATFTRDLFQISISRDKTKDIRTRGMYAANDFFKMFSHDILEGNKQQVLPDKNSIALSDDLAMKLFSTTENLIGKTVEYQHEKPYTISAIFRKPPASATDQFDFVISTDVLKEIYGAIATWGNTAVQTYVQLKPGTEVGRFGQKVADFVKVKSNNEVIHRTLFLKKYSELYLYGEYENGALKGGRIDYVRMFSIIAIFILIIACINFMNLSTAKAAQKLKEVGIKKVVGASRTSLVLQYLGQSMLMTFIALLIAFALVIIFLPSFNTITGKQMALVPDARMLLSFLGIALFTGFVAGSYPALYLSGFNPIAILKGKLRNSAGEIWVRKGLVIFQFSLSVILIVSVLVVYKQISFVQSTHLGYNKDNLVTFSREGKLNDDATLKTFLAELRQVPGVVAASSTGHDMTGHNSGTSGIKWLGKDPNDRTEFENFGANYDMIETMGFEMKEGRSFSSQFSTDTGSIIFNEAAIRFMGLKDPLGKTVQMWGRDRIIIGVVKDFNFESLHEKVKPLLIRLAPDATYDVVVRVSEGKERTTLAGMEKVFSQFNPDFSFNFNFLDENYQQMYASEKRVSILSRYFAGLAILISCLGLFGLAAFTAHRRQKEIGIRKVVGATTNNLYMMLSKDFLKLILIAIVIALPLSWWATSHWLQGFAYHTPLGADVFLIAGVTTVLITLLTISYQAIKAALSNPINSLRSE